MFIISPQVQQTEDLAKANEKQNKEEAKEIAKNLEENYPGWKDALPDCPCTAEEIDKDEFERNDYGLETHHPGAASGYRSSEPVEIKSSVNPELPELEAGQQCTFDRNGDLVTHGIGAGTPDAYSPSEYTNVLDHYQTDVVTSKYLSTKDYQKEWTPNNDNNCRENWGDRPPEPELKEEPEEDTSDRLEASLEDNNFESFIESDGGEFTSFAETEQSEFESFAGDSSELFESFSETSSESFESFSESSTEMAGESYSEYSSEMG